MWSPTNRRSTTCWPAWGFENPAHRPGAEAAPPRVAAGRPQDNRRTAAGQPQAGAPGYFLIPGGTFPAPFFPLHRRRNTTMTTRRLLSASLLCTALALSIAAGPATAQPKLRVAAIYTVPFEQQGASRIHKALKAAQARGEIDYRASENVANADYERVLREYATGGNQLIVGEVFAVEAAARRVARDFPKPAFLFGSSGKPQAPNFSVFDNYIQEPAYLSGMVAGGMTRSNKIGMVGGFPIPEVN